MTPNHYASAQIRTVRGIVLAVVLGSALWFGIIAIAVWLVP